MFFTRLKVLALSVLFFALSSSLFSEEIRMVVPYVGAVTNQFKDSSSGINLKDTKLITGLYAQWINPDVFQINDFFYKADEINYSNLMGNHFIGDVYFGPNDWYGKFLVGAGLETVILNMDAGDDFASYVSYTNTTYAQNFVMSQTVNVPYARLGKYFIYEEGPARLSFLPWAGIQPQWVQGHISSTNTDETAHSSTRYRTKIDTYDLFAIWGTNLKLTLFHMVDLEGKFQATVKKDKFLVGWSANADCFITRNFGLSYRFKYSQEDADTTTGYTLYNMIGTVFAF